MENEKILSDDERRLTAEKAKADTRKEAEMLGGGGEYEVNEKGEVVAFKFSNEQIEAIKKLAETKRLELQSVEEWLARYPELAKKLEAIKVNAPYLEGGEQLLLLREKEIPEMATLVYSSGRYANDDDPIYFRNKSEYIQLTSRPCFGCIHSRLSEHKVDETATNKISEIMTAVVRTCKDNAVKILVVDSEYDFERGGLKSIPGELRFIHKSAVIEIRKAIAVIKGGGVELGQHNMPYDLVER